MKKILIVLGSLVVLFLIAIIAIPMFVDVDSYRPKIVQSVNEKLNGKLELGKLQLSLWGSIRVEIAGLDLSDAKGVKVVAVKDAFVSIPWLSIFTGSPVLTFNMNDPAVRVVKGADGKMNVMTLMKESGVKEATPGAPGTTTTTTKTESSEVKLPSIVTNARLGLDIKNALFTYQDVVGKSETQMKNLNLRVKDLSLSRKTDVELSGLFESSAEKVFKVSGPFKISLDANPKVASGEFQGLDADFDVNFDDIEIQAGAAFQKKKGVATQAKGSILVTKDSFAISKFDAKFFNAEIKASGKASSIQTDPVLDFTVQSNTIDLGSWNELIPMLKQYSLSGTASFGAKAFGALSKIQYAADLAVKDLKAKSPMLKSEPVVNFVAKVVTDKVEKLSLTMKAPGNDLTVDGTVVSFTQPKVDLKITSGGMDFDQLVNFPPPAEKSAEAKPAPGAPGAAGKPAPSEDLDAMLEPLRKNEIAKATTLLANVNMKMIQFYGVKMTDVVAKMSMRNLSASIDSASFKLWDGTIAMKGQTAMLPKTPTYQFSASVANLDLRKAVQSKFESFKDTLLGKLNFKMDGSGSSYNTEAAKKNLNAKGSLKVADAAFQGIDVAKMAGDSVDKALDKIGDKIPALKGKSVKGLEHKSSNYEFIASDFTISNGRFIAPNFTAKAQKNSGLDVRGNTEVGLIDQELKADWEIIDTYNMTGARDVSVDVAGVHVPSILAEGASPVVIPISIGCKYTAPCPSYGKVAEHFMKIALKNSQKGATSAVKDKAVDKAKDVGKKLFKGLFK